MARALVTLRANFLSGGPHARLRRNVTTVAEIGEPSAGRARARPPAEPSSRWFSLQGRQRGSATDRWSQHTPAEPLGERAMRIDGEVRLVMPEAEA